MASEHIDKEKLLAFLRERREARGVHTPAGLALSSVYEGLEGRVRRGDFDADTTTKERE